MIKYRREKKWITQFEVFHKVSGASGGKANEKDQKDRQNCDVKQCPWYLEEGIGEQCFRSGILGRMRYRGRNQSCHGRTKDKRDW